MRFPRALMLLVLACLLAVLTAKGGLDALLTVLPLAGLIVLLVSGRYVGERRILARYAVSTARRRPAPRFALPPAAAVRSVFARAPVSWRGPPAAGLL